MSSKESGIPADPQTEKKAYERPQVLMTEQLEAVAIDCSATGKDAAGAPKPGGGTCAGAES